MAPSSSEGDPDTAELWDLFGLVDEDSAAPTSTQGELEDLQETAQEPDLISLALPDQIQAQQQDNSSISSLAHTTSDNSAPGSPHPSTDSEDSSSTTTATHTTNMSATNNSAGNYETVATDAGSMFNQTRLSRDDIKGELVTIKRCDRGSDAKAISKTKEKAVVGIPTKFSLPAWFISNKDGESDTDEVFSNANVEETVSTLANACKVFKRACTRFDMTNTLLIPVLKDESATAMDDKWDFDNRRHLVDHHGSITRTEVLLWTEDIHLQGDELDKQDLNWVMELARNSCTQSLLNRVEEEMDKLKPYQRGGPVFLHVMFKLILLVNDSVIKCFQAFIKEFGNRGLTKYVGENVNQARLQLEAVCTRLDEVDRLPEDSVDDVVDGLIGCSFTEFSKVFESFKTNRKLESLGSGIALTGSTLDKIKVILKHAEELYNEYNTSQKWPAASKSYVHNVTTGTCHNCGGNCAGGWRKCSQPRDMARIKRAQEEYANSKRQGTFPPRSNSNNGGGGGGGQRGTGYGTKQWKAPKNGEVVRKINKRLYVACKHCGWNKSHSTKYHDAWESNKSGFCLPTNHPYHMEMLKFNAVRGGGGGNPNGGTPQGGGNPSTESGAPAGILRNGGGDSGNKSVSFGAVSAAAAELERSSADASEQLIAAMIRKVLESAGSKG